MRNPRRTASTAAALDDRARAGQPHLHLRRVGEGVVLQRDRQPDPRRLHPLPEDVPAVQLRRGARPCGQRLRGDQPRAGHRGRVPHRHRRGRRQPPHLAARSPRLPAGRRDVPGPAASTSAAFANGGVLHLEGRGRPAQLWCRRAHGVSSRAPTVVMRFPEGPPADRPDRRGVHRPEGAARGGRATWSRSPAGSSDSRRRWTTPSSSSSRRTSPPRRPSASSTTSPSSSGASRPRTRPSSRTARWRSSTRSSGLMYVLLALRGVHRVDRNRQHPGAVDLRTDPRDRAAPRRRHDPGAAAPDDPRARRSSSRCSGRCSASSSASGSGPRSCRRCRTKGSACSIPVGQLSLFVILAGLAGLLAGWLPARRAAHLDVLGAINAE